MATIRKRIDNLGRIVIPKEIRNQLRIREGEKLEVSTSGEDIILKKQQSQNEINKIAQQVIQIMGLFVEQNILISSRDYIVACSPNVRSTYLNQLISEEMSKKIEERSFKNVPESIKIIDDSQEENVLIEPIIYNGDIEGIIMLQDGEENKKIMKPLAQFIAEVL